MMPTFLTVQALDWFMLLLLKYLRLLYQVKFNLFPKNISLLVQIIQRDFAAALATATFAIVLKFATSSVVK
jgi:hypothetical protein